MDYLYDFSDGWRFVFKLESVVDEYYFAFPNLLDGLSGHYEFLNILNDETHPEYEITLGWTEFLTYDPVRINQRLK